MRRHAGEAAFVGVATFALVAVVARFVPTTYESVAVVEASGGVPPAERRADGELREQIQQFAQAPDQMVLLSRGLRREGEDLGTAERSLHGAVTVAATSKTRFSISFRARSADQAQKGNTLLVQAMVASFGGLGAGGRDTKAQAALDAATKELADFVSAHPNDVTGPTAAPVSTAGNDVIIGNLRKERAVIEAKIAETAKPNDSSPVARENPYVEPAAGEVDTAQLQRRLVEIRNQITALQKESTQKADAARKANSQGTGNESEWQRKARAVAEAQRVVAAATATAAAAPPLRVQLVEPASKPSGATSPLRLIVTALGLPFGMTSAALWAFLRGRFRRRRPRVYSERFGPPASQAVHSPPPPAPPPPLTPMPPRQNPARPNTDPSPGPRVGPQQQAFVIPKAPAVPNFSASQTQIGIVDPATFRAATSSSSPPGASQNPLANAGKATAPHGTRPQQSSDPGVRMQPMRTVSVGGQPKPSSNPPPPNAAARPVIQAKLPDPPVNGVPKSPSPVPPPPPRSRSNPPPAPQYSSQNPNTVRGNPARPEPHPLDGWNPQGEAPNTQRFGSQTGQAPQVAQRASQPAKDGNSVAPYRPDTTYSFVDRSSRVPRRRSDTPGGTSTPPNSPEKNADAAPMSEPPVQATQVEVQQSPAYAPPANPSPVNPPGAIVRPSWSPGEGEGRSEERALAKQQPPLNIVEVRTASPSFRAAPDLGGHERAAPELLALRDQLLELGSKQCFVVGVAGEFGAASAKSKIATRLATLLAAAGRARVLLVEADFDFPAVHELTGVEMPLPGGFSQQLRARIRRKTREPWIVVRGAPNLDVLAEGTLRSPGVVFSVEFSEAINELRRAYDIIVVDAPMSGSGSEYKPIDAVTDGLVAVGRPGGQLSETLERTSRLFQQKALVAAVHAEAANFKAGAAAPAEHR
jgi:Mrp family chromosome partitioning ATPase